MDTVTCNSVTANFFPASVTYHYRSTYGTNEYTLTVRGEKKKKVSLGTRFKLATTERHSLKINTALLLRLKCVKVIFCLVLQKKWFSVDRSK